MEVHKVETLELTDSITPALRNYVAAMREGFFENPVADDGMELWHSLVLSDRTRLRAIYDVDRPFGMQQQPVATFASWDATINTGRELAPCNMITDVTVQATHRRQGLMNALVTTDLDEARERGAVFSALTATDARIYSRFGFGVSATARSIELNTGPRFQMVTKPSGQVVFADPGAIADERRAVFDQFHRQQFWSVERANHYWVTGFDWKTQSKEDQRAAVHLDESGKPDGFAVFVVRDDHLLIRDLLGLNIAAELELLRILAHTEGHEKVLWPRCYNRRHPLTWALSDHRVAKTVSEYDTVWVRIMDVERALAMRAFDNDGHATIAVDDPMGQVSGTYALEVRGGVAAVERTDAAPDVSLQLATLSALYSGLAHPMELAATGTIEGSREGLMRVGALFVKELPGIAAAIF